MVNFLLFLIIGFMFSTIQASVRTLIKKVIITTFEELDNNFKNSAERKSRYYINKSNVSRTLITIVGEVSFKRTYYKNKLSTKISTVLYKIGEIKIFILFFKTFFKFCDILIFIGISFAVILLG